MTTIPAMPPVRAASTDLRGVFTALVTPFDADLALDADAFVCLVRRQADAGVSGVVPVGTTGEAPTLSGSERERLIELTCEALGGGTTRPTVIAGTGTYDTRATIAATRRAARIGADAALVVAPYYNRPNQRMLEAHFLAVAEEGGLPIVVYNVPSRTGSNVSAETLLRIAEHERVVGVKEASGDLDQIAVILRERPPGFAVLAGDDAWTLPVLALGGEGVVSVASNEVPAEMVALCDAAMAGDWDRARAIQARLLPLMRANFAGAPNPVPVKAAIAMLGLAGDHVRQPLLPLGADERETLARALDEAGAAVAVGAAR